MTVSPSPASRGASRPTLALRRELARKAIHLGSAALPIGWGLGVLSPDTLRLILTVALAVAVLIEGARHLSPAVSRSFESLVGPLLRPHERVDLTGATWLAASMLAALIVFPPGAAIIALWAAAAGDGAASIIGRLVTHWRGTAAAGKTLAGSAACAAVTMAGALWFTDASWTVALLVGALTALAERPRGPLDDNVRVALAAGLSAWVLGVA